MIGVGQVICGSLRPHRNSEKHRTHSRPGVALDGLSSLKSALELTISDNAALTNLDGLSSLTSVAVLFIDFNPALTNLDGRRSDDETTQELHLEVS